MLPKAHPNSDDPGFEWRVSFSLVEKRILGKIHYLFRKVYLICKRITVIEEWKKHYNFPSYILKTAFLWILEEKWKEPEAFTEDNILSMIVEIFSYLKRYFEKDNIPNYFIPEMNILEQYSQIVKKNSINSDKLIEEVTRLANKKSLIQYICETFKIPFSPIIKKGSNSSELSIFSLLQEENSFLVTLFPCVASRELLLSSHHHLYQWYEDIILLDRGIQKEGDKKELLCELYITFLYLLYARVLRTDIFRKEENHQHFQHVLYFLYVFGEDLIDSDLDAIMKYCKSIINYFSLNDPFDQRYKLKTTLALFQNRKIDEIQRFREKYNIDIPRKDWIDGRINDESFSLIHDMNEFGSEKHSKDLQKNIEEAFRKDDDKFEFLVNNLNKYFCEKFYDRCFIEIETENSKISYFKSYLSNYLVDHMCEMYDYGFIERKSFLPKPKPYISYLSQLLLNVKCCVKKKIEIDDKMGYPFHRKDDILTDMGSPINSETEFSKWGFTLKDGNYISYEQRKHATIPFTWIYQSTKSALKEMIL